MNDQGLRTRAIVCFVEDNKHLIQQTLALRHSWLHVASPDTDLVVMGPRDVLDRLPDDLVKIEQRAVADDAEWMGYRFINSVAALNGPGAHLLDRYTHLLRADVDTFITPAWNSFYPTGLICGTGGYSNSDDVRRRIRDVAARFGLTHRGLTNVGSTWYGPTALVRNLCSLAELLVRHLLLTEFRLDEGAWPEWYRGVSLLYASEIAVNHLAPDAKATDLLDGYSTSSRPIGEIPHIHCWHTDEKFSKHWFMSGRYSEEKDRQGLDLDVIPDYCMEMSFRSLADMPAEQSTSEKHRKSETNPSPGIRIAALADGVEIESSDKAVMILRRELVPFMQLNPAESRVLTRCDGKRTLQAIVDELRADDSARASELEQEVISTVEKFVDYGILEFE